MTKLHPFTTEVSAIKLPKEFDYPHNYEPHPIAKIAAKELQEYLIQQQVNSPIFNIETQQVGKMFGILVVTTPENTLGYLAAFSGKLGTTHQHDYFVPPVFDILAPNGFYLQTEQYLNTLTQKFEELESDEKYLQIKKDYLHLSEKHGKALDEEREKIKKRRKQRKHNGAIDNQANINEEFYLREYELYLNQKIDHLKTEYNKFESQLQYILQERAQLSANVQQQIFKAYSFLNSNGHQKDLLAVFNTETQNIPAGAGDCCAPKLLQYAFKHQLTPIAMAEFWWGKPLATAIRKHARFYPACNGKCKPILQHMLTGIPVAPNPLLLQLKAPKELPVLFEDDYIVAINKPEEFLSVSGSELLPSVESIMKEKYPTATGPLIVHRLDMSTSGILLIAKTKEIHMALQRQFINKQAVSLNSTNEQNMPIKKRYVAILNGLLEKTSGSIELPLRVDFHERPKQLVCFERGKKALTHWETISVTDHHTRVHFYPITGRTHQLRVHAAHYLGLNTPILGDELYGTKTNRLYLHAEQLIFTHPVSGKRITLKAPCPF